MSIIILSGAIEAAIATRQARERRREVSLLRRAFAAIIASRRLSVERRIAFYLAGLSDARLAHLGFSDAEIKSVRAGVPPLSGGLPQLTPWSDEGRQV